MDVVRTIAIVLGAIAVIGGLVAMTVMIIRHDLKRIAAVETAWRGFVESRGFELTPHQGRIWLNPLLGESPRIRGVVDGVSFVVEISGHKTLDSTKALVSIPAPRSATNAAFGIWPERLDGAAAAAWAGLVEIRAGARMLTWHSEGLRVACVRWPGLEQQASVLDEAISLVVALGRLSPEDWRRVAG